jgi:hypothetical protein
VNAVEALKLPTAQLSPEEAGAADKFMELIDDLLRKGMARHGVDLHIGKLTNLNVIAEVDMRLRSLLWVPNWVPLTEAHQLDPNNQVVVGQRLILNPSQEAYAKADEEMLRAKLS